MWRDTGTVQKDLQRDSHVTPAPTGGFFYTYGRMSLNWICYAGSEQCARRFPRRQVESSSRFVYRICSQTWQHSPFMCPQPKVLQRTHEHSCEGVGVRPNATRMMPRNSVTKDELNCRVLKLKNELYNGQWTARNADWHEGAHTMLNRCLDMLQEYKA